MKPEILQFISVVAAALILAAAIYFRPAPLPSASAGAEKRYQAVVVDGFIYIIDLVTGQPAKIIPTK